MAAQAFGLFIVFNIVIWTICLGFSISNLVKARPAAPRSGKAAQHGHAPQLCRRRLGTNPFRRSSHTLTSQYISYIGWRREPFKGKTINLAGPYAQRATVGAAILAKPSVYFFGGSTMWGTGADDADTIPSLVTQLGGFRSENYGECGLYRTPEPGLLVELLQDGHRPDVVVFYDGVNEVAHKCRSELTPKSHAREGHIKVGAGGDQAPRRSMACVTWRSR